MSSHLPSSKTLQAIGGPRAPFSSSFPPSFSSSSHCLNPLSCSPPFIFAENLTSCRILSHLATEMTVVRGLEEELTNEFEEVRPPTLRSVVSCNGPRRTSNFTFRAPQENFTIDDFELGPVLGVGSFSKVWDLISYSFQCAFSFESFVSF